MSETMHFEGRDLKPYAEPVDPATLEVGVFYFAVHFVGSGLLVPTLEALVFLGRDLYPGDSGQLYFESSQFDPRRPDDEPLVYSQPLTQVKHIFDYERALEVLLSCSLRRRQRGSPIKREGPTSGE